MSTHNSREYAYSGLPPADWFIHPLWHLRLMHPCILLYMPWVYLAPLFIIVRRFFVGTEAIHVLTGLTSAVIFAGMLYTVCAILWFGWGTEYRAAAGRGFTVMLIDFAILYCLGRFVVYPAVTKPIYAASAVQYNQELSQYVTEYLRASPRIAAGLVRHKIIGIDTYCRNCKYGWRLYWLFDHDLQGVAANVIFGAPLDSKDPVQDGTEEWLAQVEVHVNYTQVLYRCEYGATCGTWDNLGGYPKVGYSLVLGDGRPIVYVEKGGDLSEAKREIAAALRYNATRSSMQF